MDLNRDGWRRFLPRACALGAVVFIAVRAALAISPGVANGPTRTALTVAGSLTGVADSTSAVFTFRNGSAASCTAPAVTIRPSGAGGSFSVEVDIATCPAGFFDGSDVAMDVAVGGETLVTGASINPVPYARYADRAGAALAAAPDSGLDQRIIAAANGVPPGTVVTFAGSAPPAGWLLCDGSAVRREGDYAALFRAIGTTYGTGDGTSTFNLPDLRGRVALGRDDMGGSPARRVTGASVGGANAATLGGVGGEEAHALTVAELPAHTHPSRIYAGLGSVGSGGSGGIWQNSTGNETGPAGGNAAHSSTPPWIAVNYLVRY